jgi:hypothetical protein
MVTGAAPNDVVPAYFYYPTSITGATEAGLQLRYWNGVFWALVRSSGGVLPDKDVTDNVNGTVSGGRFFVQFDNTSTPRVDQLVGTVFSFSPPPPVANDDQYVMTQDLALDVPAPGVLGNDTDLSGLTLTPTVLTGVSHGVLALNADGSFSYTPDVGYTGADSFTYQISNGILDSNSATVSINVESGGGGGPGGGPNPGATPELDSLVLFASGLLGVLGYARRRRRVSSSGRISSASSKV